MRRVLALTASAALLVGVSVAIAVDANATITAPGNGATVRGVVTLTDSGGGQSSYCHFFGSNGSTDLYLEGTSFHASNGGGTLNASLTTENYPNGAYTVHAHENYESASWGICGSHGSDYYSTIHIDNQAALAYTGDTSGAYGATATLVAKLTDKYNGSIAMSGHPVTFKLGSQAAVTVNTNSSGVATANVQISALPGAQTLTTSFAATAYYDATSVNSTFAVNKPASTVTINPGAATVHGQAYSFSASVTTIAGLGTPTGLIQFTVDGSNFGAPVALSGGSATSPSTSTLSTGNHTLGASYAGNSYYLPSSSTLSHTVNAAPTTTTLTATPAGSVYGQSVTFSASVAVPAPGAGTPTGAVQFDIDGTPYGTAVTLVGTTATLTVSSLHAGNHPVVATYNGDGNFTSSSSATLTQGVGVAPTASTLTSSDGTSVYGEPVTFSTSVSSVAPGAGQPTGSVQFSVAGTPLGDPVALDNGTANSTSLGTLAPGSYSITVDYLGSADFAGSTQSFTQQINPAQTSTSITSSASSSVFGQPVTFTAAVGAVAPGSGTPTGTVQFEIDGNPVGNPVALYAGAASSDPISDLTPGSYRVSAVYSGDGDFLAGTSQTLPQLVGKAHTGTALGAPVTSVFGQSVTFTATVSVGTPGAGGPTGTVTFSDGSTVIGSAPVGPDTGEMASVSTGALAVGSHAITASYSGDGDFLASTGSTTQVVQRAQSSVIVTASANPAESGQPVSFTAVVTAVAPGAGDPSGTVTFTVNGSPLGAPAAIIDGSATSSSFASLSPGTYAIAAAYNGDGNFLTSTASLDEGAGLNVTAAPTTMTLSGGPNPADYGQTVTLTATVTADPSATGTPTGVVRFYAGDVLLGSSSLAVSGSNDQASFAVTGLATGGHAFHAEYVGNFNFTGSSADTNVMVGSVPTITTLSATPGLVAYGQAVTMTAVVTARTGMPTGTVSFQDGSTVLGSVSLATSGGGQQASLSVSDLAAGSHQLTAVYSGAVGIDGSTSAAVPETVVKAASNLVTRPIIVQGVPGDAQLNFGQVQAVLTDSSGAPLAGQTLTFTTTQPDQYTLTICTAITDATGTVTCDSGAQLTAIDLDGGYDVAYGGSANYLPASAHGVVVH